VHVGDRILAIADRGRPAIDADTVSAVVGPRPAPAGAHPPLRLVSLLRPPPGRSCDAPCDLAGRAV
jgi:hypothetical protein